MNFIKPRLSLGNKWTQEAIPKAYVKLLPLSFLSGNVHGDLISAA